MSKIAGDVFSPVVKKAERLVGAEITRFGSTGGIGAARGRGQVVAPEAAGYTFTYIHNRMMEEAQSWAGNFPTFDEVERAYHLVRKYTDRYPNGTYIDWVEDGRPDVDAVELGEEEVDREEAVGLVEGTGLAEAYLIAGWREETNEQPPTPPTQPTTEEAPTRRPMSRNLSSW